MPQVRAVFFDAGGTLFRERTSRAAIYCEVARRHRIDVTESAMAAAMAATHAELPVRFAGAYRYSRPWFERFIAEVFARVGHSKPSRTLAPELFARFASAETFRVFDDVPEALDRLAADGVLLGVVSNWSERLVELLEKLGLARRFAVVAASVSEQLEKPDPAIFRRALARARVTPGEALHVGDDPEKDVAGAKAAGIDGVLLDRARTQTGFRGRRIATIAELPALLAAR